jgi:transcriptional regulator with XRE-family HTH domain
MRKWLINKRKKLNLSQVEMGKMLGITQAYYSEIENGIKQQDLSLSTTRKLSEILGISVDAICQYEAEQWS